MKSVINQINQIIDCPELYLIEYYDDLKSKIDFQFETKLQSLQENHLRETASKQRNKIIDIIDKCLTKCIKNEIPNELINQTKDLINKIECSNESNDHQIKESNDQLEKLKKSIQSHLFANDSYLTIYFPQSQKAYFIEEGLNSLEVEW